MPENFSLELSEVHMFMNSPALSLLLHLGNHLLVWLEEALLFLIIMLSSES